MKGYEISFIFICLVIGFILSKLTDRIFGKKKKKDEEFEIESEK